MAEPIPSLEAHEEALAAANAINPRRTFGCPECGKPAVRRSPNGPPPLFCSKKHKRAFFAREAVDGRAIIALAKGWRLSRNNKADSALGAQCLTVMSAIVDLMNERDRKDGRTTAMTLGYTETKLRGGAYMDRTDAIRAARTAADPELGPQPQPEPPQPDLAAILAQIAAGHNDPRALAAEALGLANT
jgi:endogenous inhibitor of DNA gyrase (YacG/DUF329 family)